MNTKPTFQRVGRSARYRLSARGQSTEAAYRASTRTARGPNARDAFEAARVRWAHAHGLTPDDGAYLAELRTGALDLSTLGEALAVCGQSRENVQDTVGRLLGLRFLEPVPSRSSRPTPTGPERARREFEDAEADLALVALQFQCGPNADRRLIATPLREAFFRMIVAQRFLARFH